MKKWQTTSSKILVDDKWLKFRVDSCITPTGSVIPTYYVTELGDWANCVVIDSDHNLIMVRHYRYAVDKFIPEFVSGMIEKDDSSAEDCIKRELEEEIGYVGGELYRTGVTYPNPANQTNKTYSFLAIGGACTKEQQLEAGESLSVEKIPLDGLIASIENPDSGTVYQSLHIAALFFALSFIRKSSLDSLQDLRKQLS